MTTTLAKEDVSQEFLEAVESAVGTGFGAWDMVDPREIVVAVLTAASRFDFSTATANERRVRELEEENVKFRHAINALGQKEVFDRFLDKCQTANHESTLQAHARENERLRAALFSPQKQPASVRQIVAQTKSVANQLADSVQAQSRDLTSKPHGDKSQKG